MIQGAINQLIGIAAAAKTAYGRSVQKEQKAIAQATKAEQAKQKAMKRAADRINAKYTQNKDYQSFIKSLGNNQAPEELKRIAFDAMKNQPDVRIGKDKIDISKLSPEAQAAIRGAR